MIVVHPSMWWIMAWRYLRDPWVLYERSVRQEHSEVLWENEWAYPLPPMENIFGRLGNYK